jgi:hypothetical protein
MNRTTLSALLVLLLAVTAAVAADPPSVSEATEACLMCHETIHPGIVSSWRASRHSKITPAAALAVDKTARRIATRFFGLVYSHAHPKIPDTTVIRSKDGLPLPTALDGTSWVDGHFARYDKTHDTTNAATLQATRMLLEAWEKGYAEGSAAGGGDYAVFADGYYSHSKGLAALHQWLKEQDKAEKDRKAGTE